MEDVDVNISLKENPKENAFRLKEYIRNHAFPLIRQQLQIYIDDLKESKCSKFIVLIYYFNFFIHSISNLLRFYVNFFFEKYSNCFMKSLSDFSQGMILPTKNTQKQKDTKQVSVHINTPIQK